MPILPEVKARSLRLINLVSSGQVVFRYFPVQIDSEDRANWEAQDVLTGTKPLLYSNNEPQRIRVDELWLDKTDLKQSITPEIEQLRRMMKPVQGASPPLLLLFGDFAQRVVLEEMKVERQRFTREGVPTRARVSLTFMQIQEEGRPAGRPRRARRT